jgi:hypothetical protein
LATEAAKLLLSLGVREEIASRATGALDHPTGTVGSLGGFEETAWGGSRPDRGGGVAEGGFVVGEEAERVRVVRRYGGGFRWCRDGWWRGALAQVLFEEGVEGRPHGVEGS